MENIWDWQSTWDTQIGVPQRLFFQRMNVKLGASFFDLLLVTVTMCAPRLFFWWDCDLGPPPGGVRVPFRRLHETKTFFLNKTLKTINETNFFLQKTFETVRLDPVPTADWPTYKAVHSNDDGWKMIQGRYRWRRDWQKKWPLQADKWCSDFVFAICFAVFFTWLVWCAEGIVFDMTAWLRKREMRILLALSCHFFNKHEKQHFFFCSNRNRNPKP